MSAMRKIGEYLGLLEDTGVYDDEYDEQGYAEAEEPRQSVRRSAVPAKASNPKGQPAPVSDLSERRRTPTPRRPAASPSSR